MQADPITITVDGVNLVYSRDGESADASVYTLDGEHTTAKPSTLSLKRSRSAANATTGFPGNKRPTLVIRMTSPNGLLTDGVCCAPAVAFADASVTCNFVLPNWDDDVTRVALLKRLGALLVSDDFITRLTKGLQV